MWGSALADLAKKAQALQEQATSLSATTGGLFNLDSMQGTATQAIDKGDTGNNDDDDDEGFFQLPPPTSSLTPLRSIDKPNTSTDHGIGQVFPSARQTWHTSAQTITDDAPPPKTSPSPVQSPALIPDDKAEVHVTVESEEWDWEDKEEHLTAEDESKPPVKDSSSRNDNQMDTESNSRLQTESPTVQASASNDIVIPSEEPIVEKIVPVAMPETMDADTFQPSAASIEQTAEDDVNGTPSIHVSQPESEWDINDDDQVDEEHDNNNGNDDSIAPNVPESSQETIEAPAQETILPALSLLTTESIDLQFEQPAITTTGDGVELKEESEHEDEDHQVDIITEQASLQPMTNCDTEEISNDVPETSGEVAPNDIDATEMDDPVEVVQSDTADLLDVDACINTEVTEPEITCKDSIELDNTNNGVPSVQDATQEIARDEIGNKAFEATTEAAAEEANVQLHHQDFAEASPDILVQNDESTYLVDADEILQVEHQHEGSTLLNSENDKANVTAHESSTERSIYDAFNTFSLFDTYNYMGNSAKEPENDETKEPPPSSVADGMESGVGDSGDAQRGARGDESHNEIVQGDEGLHDPTPTERVPTLPFEPSVPASVLDNFAFQMQRLEDHHHTEIQELRQKHKDQLQIAMSSSSHDNCKAVQIEIETKFIGKISEKEGQIQELMKANEGYQLKIDVMKRELTGTRALLEKSEKAVGNVNAVHNRDVQLLEQRLKKMEEAALASKESMQKLQDTLKVTKDELEASNEAYTVLKSRVKMVATELKERRIECRTLNGTVGELTETNEMLQTQLTNLQSQLSERDRSQSEKDEGIERLRGRVKELEAELAEAEQSLKQHDAVGEKALTAYKKKAQSALAIANARSAAATQAKEEAELEASAARSTAEEAVERARVAEAAGMEALAEAREYVREMESEKAALARQLLEASEALSRTRAELNQIREELVRSRTAQENLTEEFNQMRNDHQQERAVALEVRQELSDSKRRSNELYEEVETLREELRRSAAAAFMASQASGDSNGKTEGSYFASSSGISGVAEKSESEGTILMLQRELRDANQAIKELKETLRNTLVNDGNSSKRPIPANPTGSMNGNGPLRTLNEGLPDAAPTQYVSSSGATHGNDTTPLFYAMEKQAELNTARNEINRLANLLGDAESSKMEAFEAMDIMRQKMEEAEARLQRYEKLGTRRSQQMGATMNASFARDGYGRMNRRGSGTESVGSTDGIDTAPSNDASGNVNLEYLKNVMLSYLNAKTLTERKALVPVVGAVLCLTAEEQAKALRSVEETGGLEGMSMALFENLGSRVKRTI